MSCALSELFLAQVSRRPNEIALQTTTEAITFSKLHSRAVTIRDIIAARKRRSPQHALKTGLSVAIACGTARTAEICAVLAVVLAGGCFIPLDESLPLCRLLEVVGDAQPDTIIVAQSSSASHTSAWRHRIAAVSEVGRRQGCQLLDLEDNGQPVKSGDGQACGDTGRSEVGNATTSPSPTITVEANDGARASADNPFAAKERPRSAVRGCAEQFEEEHAAPSKGGAMSDGGMPTGAKVGYCCSAVPDNEDLLYILYTSGTTGMPKGVRGTRSGALNRIRFGWSLSPFRNEGELVCRRTPSCFVDFVAEVFCPLLAGVPIFLPDSGAHADPLLLVPALASAKASRITLTPSLLASVLRTTSSQPLLPDLHTWFVSGEALHPDLALLFRQRVSPSTQLVNLYGSTEVSGDATFCTLDDVVAKASNSYTTGGDSGVLIGKPLPGIHLLVVGPDLRPVPSGQPGELLVGGVGVALGYHRRPQETRDRFLRSVAHNPRTQGKNVVHIPGLEPGHRVVRTRDRVVQPKAGGPLFWLGKLDGEVKVRGARVSLEEVEVVACRTAGLPTGSFAVAFDPGRDTFQDSKGKCSESEGTLPATASTSPDRGRLWGFFDPNRAQGLKQGDGLAKLRLQLAERLTPAQLPAVLVPVEEGFPLTTSGKVDRRGLLRKYRKHAVELLGEQQVTCTKMIGAHLPEDPRSESRGIHTTARNAIAQAVVAVLPNAQAGVAAWLSQSESTGEGRDFSNLTFRVLGGTSLLAVEAAWRASNHAVRIGRGPATAPVPPSCRLSAENFLRGTLEEAVLILDDILRTASPCSVRTKTVADKVVGGSTNGLVPTDDGLDDVAAVADPVSTVPRASIAVEKARLLAPLARRKRRYGETEKCHGQERLRTFFAASRAGAGFRHTRACLGEVETWTGHDSGVEKSRVELEVRWSSCLSKCIDATPLVVLPKPTGSVADRASKGCTDQTGGVTDDASTQSSPPECFCRSNLTSLGHGSEARKVEDGRSTVSGKPQAPVNPQGSVYIGSHSGEFQALDLVTGEREWSFTAKGRIESGAACSLNGRTLFVGCHDGNLYAINRRTGALSWSFKTGDAIKCTPVCMPSSLADVLVTEGVLRADDGTVLVGSHDGILRSLGETDGRLRWSFNCSGALFASVAHDSAARVVYAATTKGRVVALDSSALVFGVEAAGSAVNAASNHRPSGVSSRQPTIVWDTYLPAPCFSTPAVCHASGNVMLGCVNGGLYCLSSAGEQIWVCRRGEKPVFSSPCLLPCLTKEPGADKDQDGTPIVWGCHDGIVRCRAGTAPTWEANIGRGQPVFSSPCFAAVGCEGCAVRCAVVFACTVSGSITALCLSSGAVVGEKQLPGEIFSSPVAVGRDLVVGCRDNRVYVLRIAVTCCRCAFGAERVQQSG